MRNGISVSLAFSLMTLLVASATAAAPGRLSTFAARQNLCDKVSMAMADGQIDRAERFALLSDAKEILKPEEYESFKRSIDRASPPVPVTKRSMKVQKPADVAQTKVDPPREAASTPSTPSLASEIFAEPATNTNWDAPMADRVALPDGAR